MKKTDKNKKTKNIDVILVEDSPSDVKILKIELEKEYNLSLRTVETEEEYNIELDTKIPDIILSDYTLPRFNGLEALEIRNKQYPGLPFILVTGSINEETAVKVMKAGADDYIIKEHLARLGASIRSAIERSAVIREKENAQKKLKESEETFQNIFNNSSVAIYIQDKNGVFLDINRAAVNLYGYEKEYLIGRTPEIVDAPGKNDLKKISGYIEQAFKGTPQRFEFWAKKKNGEIFPKLVTLERGRYFGQKVVFAYAIDISERKKAQIIDSIQHHIANAVVVSKDLRALFKKVKEELGRLMDTRNFIVAIYDEKNKTISIPFEADEVDEIPKEIPVDVTITGYTIQKKKPVFLFKEQINKLISDGVTTVMGTIPEAWIGVPMIVKKKVVGVIIIQSYTDRDAFSEEDLKVIELVANQLSIFIEKKRDEEELVRHRENLEGLVNERTKELEERTRDLERYNKAFIEREFRIKELRDQVKDLKSRLNIAEKE